MNTDRGIVIAVEKAARAATERILAIWREQGRRAAPEAKNPYRPGTAAAMHWQRGRDAPKT